LSGLPRGTGFSFVGHRIGAGLHRCERRERVPAGFGDTHRWPRAQRNRQTVQPVSAGAWHGCRVRFDLELKETINTMVDQLNRFAGEVTRAAREVGTDARNSFTRSAVLERRGMEVLTATAGNEAIELLRTTSGVAITLMDIMLPEMDGYQTIEVNRKNPAFRRLPIIALIANAMKGDREKCLVAGASDYLAKPCR
jgi:CheY-like chemotaxis protein